MEPRRTPDPKLEPRFREAGTYFLTKISSFLKLELRFQSRRSFPFRSWNLDSLCPPEADLAKILLQLPKLGLASIFFIVLFTEDYFFREDFCILFSFLLEDQIQILEGIFFSFYRRLDPNFADPFLWGFFSANIIFPRIIFRLARRLFSTKVTGRRFF